MNYKENEKIMKKIISILMAVTVFTATFGLNAGADAVAKLEPLNPYGVTLWVPRGLVGNYKLQINDSIAIDDDKNFTSRKIYTTDAVGESDKVTLSNGENGKFGLIRFKMAKDWSGSRRWKQSFTWEFDFRIDTLDNYIMLKFGNAGIKFIKDTETNQYYINWDSNTDEEGISHSLSTVSNHEEGTLLQFGENYHIRIEADMAANGGLFVIFTNPASGEVRTSYMPHGLTITKEDYMNTNSAYNAIVETVGRVYMETANEKMLYEKFFIRSHEIEAQETTVKATADVLSTINYQLTDMPYLFLAVYDSNGAMLKSGANAEGETIKQPTGEDGFLIEANCKYSVELDVSDLDDGVYTIKTFIWRNPEDMVVCKESIEKEIVVSDGVITEVR